MLRLVARMVFFCLLAFLLLFPASSSGEERILDFQSSIRVHENGVLTVTETIRVRAEGGKIKRGIYRDFPTRYRTATGLEKAVGLEVDSAGRDGNPEAFHTKPLGNSIRVYMGREDRVLDHGEHTYTLTYRTDRQIGFFETFDELYWNVTGNGWEFPIDAASATVVLPSDAGRSVLSSAAYTGLQGDRGHDFRIEINRESGTAFFHTTRSLGQQEGFTIALSWPKGYVAAPSPEQAALALYEDNRGPLWGFAGILFVLLYYFIVWAKVGKDPEAGVIMVRYSPPDRMSPAVMRYIRRMGFDGRCLAAAVIRLAVQGHALIRQDDGTATVKRSKDSGAELFPDEQEVKKLFLSDHAEVRLDGTNRAVLRKTVAGLRKHLRTRYETIYFLTNRWYFIAGLVLSAVVILVSGFEQARSRAALPAFFFISVWLTFWTFGVTMLVGQVVRNWKAVFRGGGLLMAASAVFSTVFCIPFLAGEAFGLYFFSSTVSSYLIPGFLLTAVLLNLIFFRLLKAPTRAGRRLLDEIEGFRTYLDATEKDRLNFMNPPERSPELFERYLPYALALDVEQHWAEQFSDVLASAVEKGEGAVPAWHTGPDWTSAGVAGFASSLASFSDAVSAASAPGSSSGSGGGGSSGGGGGGGGGGW